MRVLGDGRSLYFREEWNSVLLYFPDSPKPATVRITPSFWRSCPELRSRAIRAFLRRNGLIPWPRDHPPHFELEPLGQGRFRLQWLEHRPVQPTLGLFEGLETADGADGEDTGQARGAGVRAGEAGGSTLEGGEDFP